MECEKNSQSDCFESHKNVIISISFHLILHLYDSCSFLVQNLTLARYPGQTDF